MCWTKLHFLSDFSLLVIFLVGITFAHFSFSENHYRVVLPATSDKDNRFSYKHAVIKAALESTRSDFGDYHLKVSQNVMTNARVIKGLVKGAEVNVYFGMTTTDLERKLIPIRIPIRMGILNYRLLLIHRDNLPLFERVTSIEELKKFRAGARPHWVTRKILSNNSFEVVESHSYESIFTMLEEKRFDFVMRGINEIFDEKAQFDAAKMHLVIEPNIAIHFVAPFYVFISPHKPKLARRMNIGLERMVADGRLKALFLLHHSEKIKRADITSRRIIAFPPPNLPAETPLNRKALWIWSDINIPFSQGNFKK